MKLSTSSGCGKTSLLAGLSQRLRGNLNADITFDGKTIDRNKMTNISGFVPQSNVLVEGLTVCEHFYFMVMQMNFNHFLTIHLNIN